MFAAPDTSFGDCSGGYVFDYYNEIGSMIKQAFEIVLKVKWWDPHIEQLWEYAIGESIPEANEIYLSSDYLNQLRVDLFIDAGADNCPGPIDAGGGPGYDSVIELFYAQNPEKVFKKPWRF